MHLRVKAIKYVILAIFVVILLRLSYWQLIKGGQLQTLANNQHTLNQIIPAQRGSIYASDQFPLVTNKPVFTVFAYLPDMETSPESIARDLAPHLTNLKSGTQSAQTVDQVQNTIQSKLTTASTSWVPLQNKIPKGTKEAIESLSLPGIGFDLDSARDYPEASMAAQLIGFVGSDGAGNPKGYFGLEGFYDRELTGKIGLKRLEKDVAGRPIALGEYQHTAGRDGRSLITHIDRGLQLIVERTLQQGVTKYQAVSGEVIVMDPQTGGILAVASLPSFDPANYKEYPQSNYRLPSISNTYEPGSTFKTLIMASALDAGVIKPTDTCDEPCAQSITIGPYTIQTWNNEYNPGQTMTQVLERSDNVGMVNVANRLGKEQFIKYITDFGLNEPTNIDMEGEAVPKLRQKWGDIDVATGSFGQGLAVTSIRMLTAVGALANQGKLMQPSVVKQVQTVEGTIDKPPKVVRQVISQEAANQITQMMIQSAAHGEAHWRIPQGYSIAGKTGTAQVPIAGHYDQDKTIASFVGFAPATNPHFVMLVKLKEPQSSPWASETAAPLWFDLANQMLRYFNLPPQE